MLIQETRERQREREREREREGETAFWVGRHKKKKHRQKDVAKR